MNTDTIRECIKMAGWESTETNPNDLEPFREQARAELATLEAENRYQAAMWKSLFDRADKLRHTDGTIRISVLWELMKDTRSALSLLSKDVNLVNDIQDEQGRRRYTLGSVDGCPSMIPDGEGFWTPVND